jgi:hypothetical protein
MTRGLIEPPPRNLTDTTRVLVWLPGADGVANHPLTGELASLSVEASLPIRRFYSWKGKRNYEGRWWCSTSRGHVEFESLLERDALMMADFDVDVVAVAAQPLAFLWPRQIKGSTYHVPDYFVRLSNGDGRIVDVKRPAAVDSAEKQFGLTRAACNEIGWQYEVFTGIQPIVGKNVRWLSGYRQDRYVPHDGIMSAIIDAFMEPTALGLGVERAARKRGARVPDVLANAYHLMWKQALRADLTAALSMQAEVWA